MNWYVLLEYAACCAQTHYSPPLSLNHWMQPYASQARTSPCPPTPVLSCPQPECCLASLLDKTRNEYFLKVKERQEKMWFEGWVPFSSAILAEVSQAYQKDRDHGKGQQQIFVATDNTHYGKGQLIIKRENFIFHTRVVNSEKLSINAKFLIWKEKGRHYLVLAGATYGIYIWHNNAFRIELKLKWAQYVFSK